MDTDILMGGAAIFFGLIILFVSIGLIVVLTITNWKLFKKAGKEGWEAIIPFYNSWVLVEISGLSWWWFLLILAPNIAGFINEDIAGLASLASTFASFNCYYNLAKKFRKSTSTAVLAGIFNFVFIFIFAFSKNEIYYNEEVVSSNGVFPGESKTNTSSTQNVNTANGQNINPDANQNAPVSETNQLKFCSKCGCKIEDNYKFCAVCGQEYTQHTQK